MLEFSRYAVSTSEEAEQIHNNHHDLDINEAREFKGYTDKISDENESKAWEFIGKQVEIALSLYITTLD